MIATCDCCVGVHVVTPRMVVNRPGLRRLQYRIGTHGSFLASMIARLSSHDHPSLAALTARDREDASIALLDGWATVADVLTFYQERIANEGYLRTATERRSILELGRLVGWALRPGISATAYLSFTVDPDPQDPAEIPNKDRRVTIPKGSQAQSVPDPGPLPPTKVTPVALPQVFETDEDLEARALWSRLEPRRKRPIWIESRALETLAALYLEGTLTNLKPDGRLVLEFSDAAAAVVRIASVAADVKADLTTVRLLGTRARALAALKLEIATYLGGYSLDDLPVPTTLTATQQELVKDVFVDLVFDVDVASAAEGVDEALAVAIAGVTEAEIAYRSRGWTKVAAWAHGILDQLQEFRGEAITLARAPFDIPLSGAAPFVLAEEPTNQETGRRPLLDTVLLGALRKAPSIPPRDSRALQRTPRDVFQAGSSESIRLLTTLDRRLALTLDPALEAVPGEPSALTSVSAMRIKCQPFGATASLRPIVDERGMVVGSEEWPLAGEATFRVKATITQNELNDLTLALKTSDEGFEVELGQGDPDASFGKLGDVTVDWNDTTTVTLKTETMGTVAVALTAPSGVPAKVNVGPDDDVDFAVAIGGRVRRSIGSRRYDVAHVIREGHDVRELDVVTRLPVRPSPPDVIFLDAEYEGILPGSWAVIERPSRDAIIANVIDVRSVARADYGLTAKVTRIKLSEDWLNVEKDLLLSAIREATVFVLSESLKLALEPFDDDICGDTIELQRLYPGLQTGRWIIVEGERTDVPATGGVRTAELAMIARVVQDRDPVRTTDTVHTYLTLAKPLAYCYRRATATIHGNVAKASHGETRTEVLGSGDAARPLQGFSLRARPLTYLPDRNALGASSTLELRVDTVRWSEASSLVDLGPSDHVYILKTDDADVTTATTGTGRNGARLPTGPENVRATYRTGTGIDGNLPAARISQLMSRPLGVSAVINPLPSTGGADRESLEQGRRNLPLGVLSLDRLVSVQDYEDFTRARAGIGQASAASLSDGARRVVHLTIAGAGDAPIDPSSDLYRSVREALHEAGDPAVPVSVAVRELALLVIEADVHIADDRRWDLMEPAIRAALLDAFSFDRRRLGQDVFVSEVQAAIQAVPGVVYSDVNTLATVPESVTPKELEDLADRLSLPSSGRVAVSFARYEAAEIEAGDGATLSAIAADNSVDLESLVRLNPSLAAKPIGSGTPITLRRGIRPAQIALLSPIVRDTLILRDLPK